MFARYERVFHDSEYDRFDLVVFTLTNGNTVVAVRDNQEGRVLDVWLDKEELGNLYRHLGDVIMELNR